ncbi:hypothetical protein CR513_07960, partial [Mucuna pruriens]
MSLSNWRHCRGNTHHFDNRGATTSRGMNGITTVDNQRLGSNIDGYGIPQPKAMNNMQLLQKESSLGNWTNHMPISNT